MKKLANKTLFVLIALFFTTICVQANADVWSGKVVGVADGDTITVMHNGKGEKIRLYGIDCPEKRQAFGKKAKQFTSGMVFNKVVNVEPVATDRYGRTVAWINIDGSSLNTGLIKAGLAWHYKRYSSDKNLAVLEDEARHAKAGLWADQAAQAPWAFRRGGKRLTHNVNLLANTDMIYHGNHKSMIFHRPGCRYYNCKKCTVEFSSRKDAINAGYKPCKICKP